MPVLFADRDDAGRQLAGEVAHRCVAAPVVVGLPRGGVPVAYQIATAIGAPLDVLLVRKLGVPHQPELAMGAIGEGGVEVLHDQTIRLAGVSPGALATVERRERAEMQRRSALYRQGERFALRGRTVIIVDDGLATGATALAACRVARAEGAARVVLAVPVAPPDWTDRIGPAADEFIALETPDDFEAVGQYYADFSATTDEQVISLLAAAREDGR